MTPGVKMAFALLVLIGASANAAPVGPLSTYLVEPCRLVDTREPALSQRQAWAATNRVQSFAFFFVRGRCGVAADAKGVIVNVTAVRASGEGFLRLWGANTAQPTTSSLNFASLPVANEVTVMTPACACGDDTGPDLALIAVVPGGGIDFAGRLWGVDVVIDVVGYLR